MSSVFAFLRHSGDRQLEREFKELYQEPNVRYARFGVLLAVAGFGGFHAMDVAAGRVPAMDWAGAARLGLTLMFAGAAVLIVHCREFVLRFYTPLANVFFFVAVQGAALLPIAVHGNRSNTEFYWSLNASLVTAIIVIYGFSRLTARNTAVVVVAGCATGVATTAFAPFFDLYYFGRLVLHLAIVNIASFSLRQSVEGRERDLFLLAKDNLRKNIYAKELEVAKARAEEADKVKMRFLANMSHEFRTPISGVVQTLEVVRRTADAEVARLVAKAVESSNAFLSTINSILDYTRWSQEGLSPAPSCVSVAAAVRRVVARHRQALSRRGLALHLRLDLTDSEDYVKVDEVMLGEVLGKVLDNAIKFTRSGRVDFAVELKRLPDQGDSAVSIDVVVADTGIGIPADAQPLLGTAFYQVDSDSNRMNEGTGLGLAIVARLVSALGGTWSVSSIEGQGTTVRLSLPVEVARRPAGARDASFRNLDFRHHEILPLAGNVLLVEDNDLNADLARDLLSVMGLDVTRVADGRQATGAVGLGSFDLVLMDCQMPVMDGYEATRTIRRLEAERGTRRVAIVAVTANALAGDRERCLEAGMDDYLAKPYTADQLREVLTTWLPERARTSARASSTVTAP
ncbi:MAG: response regulator [Burkholderiales bacterium]|nr:response regulator [Burkholderiales bacterium]